MFPLGLRLVLQAWILKRILPPAPVTCNLVPPGSLLEVGFFSTHQKISSGGTFSNTVIFALKSVSGGRTFHPSNEVSH